MDRKLYIVGLGPGSRKLLHPAAAAAIEESDVLIGGKRNLEAFEDLNREKVEIGNNLEEVYTYIMDNIGLKRIAVLVTGDPGIYSIMEFLKSRLVNAEIEVLPGISSIQYLCSKLKLSWNDMFITSLHGRQQEDLADIVGSNKKVAVFTGGKCRPDKVCQRLLEYNLTDVIVTVGENLSYPNERIVRGVPEEIGALDFDSLSVMIIENGNAEKCPGGEWIYAAPGIPDDRFIRGDVPMTKEEVRAVSLSKLRLKEDSIVYDIGAGTGSVSIECGICCKKGRVFAVEKEPDAVELITKNIEKFRLSNVEIVRGEAPAAAAGGPAPDKVFVGGTGGNMEEILKWVNSFDKNIRVVINSVTIESTYEAVNGLEKQGFENIDIVNMAVSRSRAAGKKHLMQAQNPVYIISAEKGGRQ